MQFSTFPLASFDAPAAISFLSSIPLIGERANEFSSNPLLVASNTNSNINSSVSADTGNSQSATATATSSGIEDVKSISVEFLSSLHLNSNEYFSSSNYINYLTNIPIKEANSYHSSNPTGILNSSTDYYSHFHHISIGHMDSLKISIEIPTNSSLKFDSEEIPKSPMPNDNNNSAVSMNNNESPIQPPIADSLPEFVRPTRFATILPSDSRILFPANSRRYYSPHQLSAPFYISSLLPFDRDPVDSSSVDDSSSAPLISSESSSRPILHDLAISLALPVNTSNNESLTSRISLAGFNKGRFGTSYGTLLRDSRFDLQFSLLYHSEYFDDPNLRSGKHRIVMNLPGFMSSVVSFVRGRELKSELNDKFRSAHEWLNPSMSLSKLRKIKQILLNIGVELNLELSTIALSYVYYDKIMFRNVIEKNNRKLIAAVCLILAFKYNEGSNSLADNGGTTIGILLNELERNMSGIVKKNEVLAKEFEIFTWLGLSLDVSPPLINQHLEAIKAKLERIIGEIPIQYREQINF